MANLEKNIEEKLVTLTVQGDYDSYSWYIENVKKSCTEKTLVFDTASVAAGVYEVKVVATKGALVYSAQVSVKVQ